jgi:uncharacterized protein (TIGR02453 family)
MAYFSTETLKFLNDIKQHNIREWFAENKSRYDEHIDTPTKFFAEDMSIAISKITGEDIASKIFRFYRDLRFSKDKTPYNTHIRLAFFPITKRVKKLCDAPNAFYFSLEGSKLMLGSGNMHFDPVQLSHFRKKIKNPNLVKNLDTLCQQYINKNYSLSEPDLKKLPTEFQQTDPYSNYSKYKGLTIFKSIDINEQNIESVYDKTKESCLNMLAFYKWFSDINSA